MEKMVLTLGFTRDMANDDLEKVAADRPWLDRQVYSTAQSLVQFHQFRDWFIGSGSRMLFIDGEDLGGPAGSSSVLSTLCVDISELFDRPRATALFLDLSRVSSASSSSQHLQVNVGTAEQYAPEAANLFQVGNLLKIPSSNHQIAVIYFFCGLRTREDEGPRSMLKSLIVQILRILGRYKTLDLSFIRTQDDLVDLQQGTLRTLLSTIQQLLQQLPPYLTVYCFIDGASSYESRIFDSNGFEDAMEHFVTMIQRIILDSQAARSGLDLFHPASRLAPGYSTGALSTFNLKVLFTSPDRTRLCHNPNQRIVLSNDGLHDNDPRDPIYAGFEAGESEFGI